MMEDRLKVEHARLTWASGAPQLGKAGCGEVAELPHFPFYDYFHEYICFHKKNASHREKECGLKTGWPLVGGEVTDTGKTVSKQVGFIFVSLWGREKSRSEDKKEAPLKVGMKLDLPKTSPRLPAIALASFFFLLSYF